MPIKYFACCTRSMPECVRARLGLLASILVAVLLAACAGKPSQQQQVDSWNELRERYPRELFLSAIGEGASLEAAQQQALFNLGQQFSVRIQGITQSNNTFTSRRAEGVEEAETSAAIHTSVRRQTDQLVQGVEVYPVDLVEDVYRALAVLEKAKGRRILSSQLLELETQIQDAVQAADEIGPVRLEATGWLQHAIRLAELRDQRHQQLLVIGGGSFPPLPTRADLSQQLDQQIRSLPFALVFHPDTQPPQRAIITNALAQAGIGHSTNNADYRLFVALDQQPAFSRDGLHWMIAQLRIQLRHLEKPQGELTWELKSAAQQHEQLQGRMNKRITDTIAAEMIDQLIQLATELS